MERFVDIKLKSYTVGKHYFSEKGYVKCPDCPKLLHCSYCVQQLRNQNPHHWVGITVNEVPGCQGCQDRYQRGIEEARNEANWLRKKLNILEMRLTSHSDDLQRESHELADVTAQQLASEVAESVIEMDLRAQIEDLRKTNDDVESIMGMKLRLELEKMKDAYEGAVSRVTFLKRRPPDAAISGAGIGSTLPPLGDITFVVQGQNIYAHELILGYKSRVFQKMFEAAKSQLPQEIPEILTLKHWVEIAPILSPPPPPPPPPPVPAPAALPTPPPPSGPPPPPTEESKEKPRTRTERISPMVNVRLTPSAMLAQMGLRGVRCQLAVAPGQSLVDDATSQTSTTQLMQDSSEMNSRENVRETRAKTELNTVDSGPELQSAGTITVSEPPLVPPAVSSVESTAITPTISHQHDASGLTPVTTPGTTLPILQSHGGEIENNLSEERVTNVTFPLNAQAGPTKTNFNIKTLQAACPAGEQPIIAVHNTSYAVMRAVINCCYTSDIDFTEEVSPGEVLKVAHKYEIDYLKGLCEQELCRRLNAGNVAEMLKLGCKFGATELHSHATQFFKENFDDVQESVLNSCYSC